MDDRYIEIEPYEEIVDRDEMFSTPSGSRSASPVSVDRSLPPAQSLSQGPSTSVYNANLMTSVMRPDPRYELALASQVPHTQTEHPDTSAVAATLAPNVGRGWCDSRMRSLTLGWYNSNMIFLTDLIDQ